jgi:hypothetical protein
MLTTLAVAHYRSIDTLIVALQRLNPITGPNGSALSAAEWVQQHRAGEKPEADRDRRSGNA